MATTPIIPAISDDNFATAQTFVLGVLSEQSPALNLTPGSAIDGLVVSNEARLAAIWQAELQDLSNSFSLQAIATNIATVTDAQVDSLVSNYFLERKVAAPASGPVEVIATIAVPYNIPNGFQFSFNGQVFATTQNWNVFPPGTAVSATSTTSRAMTVRSDGTFQFTIPVTAQVAGAAGNLAAGTSLTIVAPLNGMQSASVATDFISGTNTESNADLLAQAQSGVTAQVTAGPDNIQALTVAEFPGATTSVVGLGDPLMVRDRYSLLPISTGGKQDIWCRTSASPQLVTKTYTGTVIDAVNRVVTLTVAYSDGIGAYRIPYVRPTLHNAIIGGIVPVVTVNIYPNTAYQPTVKTALDAAFTASQVLVLQFADTITPGALTLNQQISYDTDIIYMPSVGPITAFLTALGTRSAGQDLLIRAAVPASVSVAATLRVPIAGAQPDLSALKIAIAAAINAIPFRTASLGVYTVYSAISSLLVSGTVTDAALRAVINAPSGANLVLNSGQTVTIPLDTVNLVGPQNTFFCCDPSQVGLTVVGY